MSSTDDFEGGSGQSSYHPPISQDLASQHVSKFMTKNVVTVTSETSLKSAMTIMIKKEISALPIVDTKNRCLGLFSEFDAMIQGASSQNLSAPVKFSTELVCVKQDTRFRDALILLVSKRVKRLPVVDDKGHIIGIVSRRDFLKAIIDDANKVVPKNKK